jgi:hypothetical protein
MNKSISHFLLTIAVAIYLFATGIIGMSGKKLFSDGGEIYRAVRALFTKGGDFADALIVILSILAIAAGVFVLLKLFSINIPITELFLVILSIVWVVFIIMIDIVYPLSDKGGTSFVSWLLSIGTHLMALGGIALATERFGG